MNKYLQKFHALTTDEQYWIFVFAGCIVVIGLLFLVIRLRYGT